jgi:uncharacterized membrane protein
VASDQSKTNCSNCPSRQVNERREWHFCVPTFIFLAGISAFLYGTERKTNEVSRYLFTRGCWLVLIEFTVVRFGWTFSFKIDYLVIQVIFAIGVSMITAFRGVAG